MGSTPDMWKAAQPVGAGPCAATAKAISMTASSGTATKTAAVSGSKRSSPKTKRASPRANTVWDGASFWRP